MLHAKDARLLAQSWLQLLEGFAARRRWKENLHVCPPRLPRGRPAGDTWLAGLCSPGPAQFCGWPALPRAGPVTRVRASWLPCSAA